MPISPYVRRLRDAVGSDLLLLPAVAVLCRDDHGRLLLVRQSDTGTWATPGGLIEPDEDPRAAAVRETKEEAGVDIEIHGLVEALGGPEFRVRHPDGDETSYVSIVFDATVKQGEPVPDGDEILEVAWFDRADLDEIDVHPAVRPILSAVGLSTVKDCPPHVTTPEDPAWLAGQIVGRCRLQGDFLLRSGQRSDTYFDKYLLESDPQLLRHIADGLARLVPESTEVLAGLELGGIPLATAVSLATGLPVAFVRKEPKTYGTAKLAEGPDIEGKRVVIIEDVITTGGQVATSAEGLRVRGASIDTVLCVINRSNATPDVLAAMGMDVRSMFMGHQLEAATLGG